MVVVVALGWALYEFLSGTPFWGILFGALGGYAAWRLLVTFEPKDDP